MQTKSKNLLNFSPDTRWSKNNHPMFFCYFFFMKNFGSACEISLFNPIEFILLSRENVKTELTFGAICKSYSVFQ